MDARQACAVLKNRRLHVFGDSTSRRLFFTLRALQADASSSHTEAALDQWLQRARVRAYAAAVPIADDEWLRYHGQVRESIPYAGLAQALAG